MIWKGNGIVKTEKDEPALRSCWECNQAHEHLKKVNWLHYCFHCGRYWIFDRFADEIKTDSELDAWFIDMDLEPGDSTTKIDAGYRMAVLSLDGTDKGEQA